MRQKVLVSNCLVLAPFHRGWMAFLGKCHGRRCRPHLPDEVIGTCGSSACILRSDYPHHHLHLSERIDLSPYQHTTASLSPRRRIHPSTARTHRHQRIMRVLKIKVLDYTTEYVATVYLAYSNLLKDGGCSVRDIKTKLRELMTPVDSRCVWRRSPRNF